jgi:hypothetical protein
MSYGNKSDGQKSDYKPASYQKPEVTYQTKTDYQAPKSDYQPSYQQPVKQASYDNDNRNNGNMSYGNKSDQPKSDYKPMNNYQPQSKTDYQPQSKTDYQSMAYQPKNDYQKPEMKQSYGDGKNDDHMSYDNNRNDYGQMNYGNKGNGYDNDLNRGNRDMNGYGGMVKSYNYQPEHKVDYNNRNNDRDDYSRTMSDRDNNCYNNRYDGYKMNSYQMNNWNNNGYDNCNRKPVYFVSYQKPVLYANNNYGRNNYGDGCEHRVRYSAGYGSYDNNRDNMTYGHLASYKTYRMPNKHNRSECEQKCEHRQPCRENYGNSCEANRCNRRC